MSLQVATSFSMDASNIRLGNCSLIYKGFGAPEVYRSLVKMRWNDNCVYLPGLGQAIWYFRAKARRASPLLVRSGQSLSGNLLLTNICNRIWTQQTASLIITTFICFVMGKHCISLQGVGQSMIRSCARWGGGFSGPRQNGPRQAKTAA